MSRVALIGTGFWAAKLAQAAAKTELELARCWSRDKARRAAFAQRFGCEAAPSFEAALEGVDGVLLATPNDTHEQQALAAAERGLHVFVEKPIADTVAAGERMRDACERAGVTLLVGHELRRLGAARKAKQLVDAGTLGTVVLAEANLSLSSRVEPGSWKAGGRGTPLVQLGIHHADTLAYLLGPVARTTGRLARVHSRVVDDVGVATLEFSSGALGTIASSYVSPKTYALRLSGTEAVLDYRVEMSVWPATERLDEVTTLEVGGVGSTEPDRRNAGAVEFDRIDPLVAELEELARCIRGEAEPETGAAEGLAALQTIEDAIGSALAS
ncbi:MAG TPA: Gfo/Idh/MocA family oxidoreductase [Gaiellaceae bacterium]|nr:Gfo/Idh/MocA family oxidoreductase [Gaiellaceae bacterium]